MANAYKSLLRMLLTTEMSLILGPNFTLLQYPPSFPFPMWDGGEASEKYLSVSLPTHGPSVSSQNMPACIIIIAGSSHALREPRRVTDVQWRHDLILQSYKIVLFYGQPTQP